MRRLVSAALVFFAAQRALASRSALFRPITRGGIKAMMWAAFLSAFCVGSFSAEAADAKSQAICDRTCISGIVGQVLTSMVRHNPYNLPLASLYTATENSHPSALGSMTLWRTVTKAGKPDLLAVDERAGQAYFALPISEGTSISALWGRVKIVDGKLAELEFFVARSKGDHGFSFGPEQMSSNYRKIMHPPSTRKVAPLASMLSTLTEPP